MRIIVSACIATLLAGCAAQPQKTLQTLSASDPKFNSPECLDIRARALTYDDKIGERAAIGFASGLLLGPFGIPIAASVDAKQDDQRYAFNREITLRCVTGGDAIVAKQDAERQENMGRMSASRDQNF